MTTALQLPIIDDGVMDAADRATIAAAKLGEALERLVDALENGGLAGRERECRHVRELGRLVEARIGVLARRVREGTP